MSDASGSDIEWPREIWMAEREEHDQGVVSAVLSEHATIARWEGDTERDREFHRYIDADIYESAEKCWKHRAEAMRTHPKPDALVRAALDRAAEVADTMDRRMSDHLSDAVAAKRAGRNDQEWKGVGAGNASIAASRIAAQIRALAADPEAVAQIIEAAKGT